MDGFIDIWIDKRENDIYTYLSAEFEKTYIFKYKGEN